MLTSNNKGKTPPLSQAERNSRSRAKKSAGQKPRALAARQTRARIPAAQANAILAALIAAPDFEGEARAQFPDGKISYFNRAFVVSLVTLARFRRIVTPRIQAGETTETDAVNEALALWCAHQEAKNAKPDRY